MRLYSQTVNVRVHKTRSCDFTVPALLDPRKPNREFFLPESIDLSSYHKPSDHVTALSYHKSNCWRRDQAQTPPPTCRLQIDVSDRSLCDHECIKRGDLPVTINVRGGVIQTAASCDLERYHGIIGCDAIVAIEVTGLCRSR